MIFCLLIVGLGLMRYVLTCSDMLQGITTNPMFEYMTDASRDKLYICVWQIP
jgi:hypothetical protein